MRRRDFLRTAPALAGAAALGSALAGCRPSHSRSAPAGAPGAITRPQVRWRLASSFPRSLDTIYGAAERLAERVSTLTGGAFAIRVHPAGELVPALQVLDAVESGSAEIGHTASYYYKGKDPSLLFDAAVPFGLTARQHNAWLLAGGGLERMRGVFAKFGIVNLPGGNTGVQMGGWFRSPVRSLADLKGLKMRIPGMGGEVMDSLGVTVQVLAGGDIYPALERGAIDATEWVGPYDDQKLGFHQVVKTYHYPGWWEPGPALTFTVNQKAWDALPSEYRYALEAASREAALGMMAEYDAKNPVALKELLAKGVELVPFPDDVMRAAADATEGILGEIAARDPTFGAILAEWSRFRDDSNRWFATAEKRYEDFAYGE